MLSHGRTSPRRARQNYRPMGEVKSSQAPKGGQNAAFYGLKVGSSGRERQVFSLPVLIFTEIPIEPPMGDRK